MDRHGGIKWIVEKDGEIGETDRAVVEARKAIANSIELVREVVITC